MAVVVINLGERDGSGTSFTGTYTASEINNAINGAGVPSNCRVTELIVEFQGAKSLSTQGTGSITMTLGSYSATFSNVIANNGFGNGFSDNDVVCYDDKIINYVGSNGRFSNNLVFYLSKGASTTGWRVRATLHIAYIPTYTISLNTEDSTKGTVSPSGSKDYDSGTEFYVQATPIEGYQFSHWKEDNTNNNPRKITVSKNLTLTAVFKGITYYIEYDGNGATSGSMDNTNHVYGTSSNLRTNTYKRTGHTFLGWSTSSSGSVNYNDGQSISTLASEQNKTVTLYAVWQQNQYTITWENVDNGGTIVQYPVGGQTTPQCPINPPFKNPIKDYHYVFTGWDKTFQPVGEDTTYKAQFKTEAHTFSRIEEIPPVGENQQGFKRKHCDCGWFEDYDYYWKVTFRDDTEDEWSSEKKKTGDSISAPLDYINKKPQYDDKEWTTEFLGWYKISGNDGTNNYKLEENSKAYSNIIYQATYHWQKNQYLIEWYDGDGRLVDSGYFDYGVVPNTLKLPTKSPTNTEVFEHIGWRLEGAVENGVASVQGPAKYYAQFKTNIRYYTVTWKNSDGTVLEFDENIQFEETWPEYNGTTPEYPGDAEDPFYNYDFIGWSTEILEPLEPEIPGDYPQDEDLPLVRADVIYTAVYRKRKTLYQVNMYVCREEVKDICVQFDERYYEDEITLNAWYFGEPEYYDFVGWNDGSTEIQRRIRVTENKDYIAIYTPKIFNVKWLDYNETVLFEENMQFETIPNSENKKPQHRNYDDNYHYSFNGWKLVSGKFNEEGGIKSNIIYIAIYNEYPHNWKPTTYTFDEITKECTALRFCEVREEYHEQKVTVQTTAVVLKGDEPTCTEDGTTTYIAVFKDYWNKTEQPLQYSLKNIPSPGHNWSNAQKIGENGKFGYHYYYCYVCNEAVVEKHKWNEGQAVTLDACNIGGKKKKTCTTPGCNAYYYTKIDPQPHVFSDIIPHINPTCTKEGNLAYKKCNICNLFFPDNAETNSYGSFNILPFEIPKIPHNFEIEEVLQKADCTKTGEKKQICSYGCGNFRLIDIPARGHKWNTGETLQTVSCSQKGKILYTCLNNELDNKYYNPCYDTWIEEKPKLPHTLQTDKGEAPTCILNGVSDKIYCSVCGEIIQDHYQIPALGHYCVSKFLVPAENTLRREVHFTCTRKGCDYGYDFGFSE